MTTTVFMGYDRDGDKVWRLPNGKVFIADDQQEADAWAQPGPMQVTGIQLVDYAIKWGPITKEKS